MGDRLECGLGVGMGIGIEGCRGPGANTPGGGEVCGESGDGGEYGLPIINGEGTGVTLGPCCQCDGGHWAWRGARGGYAGTGGP